MKKIGVGILIAIVLAVLAVSGIAIAKGIERNPATVVPSGKTVIVSDQATENSPVLEKAIFIHYRKGFAKPPCNNDGVCDPDEGSSCAGCKKAGGKEKGPKCYGFLSKEAKLKSVEDLTIHPDLDSTAIVNSASEWDSNTSAALFGDNTIDPTANWDSETPDGRNEFSFGNYPQEGVIAVAIVWGYFSGPPKTREIVEFDVMFDTDFTWGDAAIDDPMVMDLQNIATHEIGHGAGLDDIYDEACREVTMYGYSEYGETKKRTLEAPDITGIQKLYGM